MAYPRDGRARRAAQGNVRRSSFPDGVRTELLRRNTERRELIAPFLATQYFPEYRVEAVVLTLPLKKFCFSVEDERVRHEMAGKRKVSANLRVIRARVYVLGVINVARALLVRLCWAHMKKERIVLIGY